MNVILSFVKKIWNFTSMLFSQIEALFQKVSSNQFETTKESLQDGLIPKGSLLEIMGPCCSGKTALAFFWIAQAQKQGNLCAYFHMNADYQPAFAQKLGVDIEQLLWICPKNNEQAIEIAKQLIFSGKISFLVLDTFDFETPTDANLLNIHFLFTLIRKYNCTLLFFHLGIFCLAELRFYADIRLSLSQMDPSSFTNFSQKCNFLIKAKILKYKQSKVKEELTVALSL